MNGIDRRATRRKMGAALCLTGLIGAAQGATPAASDTPLSEDDFLGEVPLVLSVSRLSQPVADAPSAVTVIDRDMIKASGFRELAERCAALGPRLAAVLEGGYNLRTLPALVAAAHRGFGP